ncbi:MAG TPA: sialidase family protein [Bdellovibrionota bacterium]|nr:sialidase family protein [Bdellovibrionota bacterium]
MRIRHGLLIAGAALLPLALQGSGSGSLTVATAWVGDAVFTGGWPSGLIRAPSGELIGCSYDRHNAVKALGIWHYDPSSSRLVEDFRVPGAGHCQFSRDAAGEPAFITSIFGERPESVSLQFWKRSASTGRFELAGSYEAPEPFTLWGDGVEKGSFGLRGSDVIAPIKATLQGTETAAFVLSSRDGGTIWQRLEARTGDTRFRAANSAAIDPNGAWLVGVQAVANGAAILKSTDGGATWSQAYWNVQANKILVKYAEGGKILALEESGVDPEVSSELLVSEDGGATWLVRPIPRTFPRGSLAMWDLAYDPALGTLAVTGAQNPGEQAYGTFVSLDLGESWQAVDAITGEQGLPAGSAPFADAHGVALDSEGYVYTIGHSTLTGIQGSPAQLRRSIEPFRRR